MKKKLTQVTERRRADAARLFVMLAVFTGCAVFAAADYNSFRIISERNIFNQNRIPHSSGRSYYRPPARPLTVSDSFALVGTLAYDTNRFAYFDGANPDYHKVLKPGETIAGYKLLAVMPNSVALDAAGKAFEMRVGTELRRFAEGGAQLLSNTLTSVDTATNSLPSVGPGAPATAAGSAAPADANEVLRRLMEKRAQELK